jgi:DNA-directed RNA polymerase specialized sigma24 family protein
MKGRSASGATATGPRVTARTDFREERFGIYFPRLFAYAVAISGDETTATQVAVEAFADAFQMPDMREPEFEIELFRAAREHCRRAKLRQGPRGDRLNAREREVISLVFDGNLGRSAVGRVLDITADSVSTALVQGLRKLQAGTGEPAAGTLAPHPA